jgi:hypothetical protein
MTKLIEFLERMGSDARLRGQDGEGFARAMDMAGIDASARHVILTEDQSGLEALVGASANVFCALHAPDDDETPPAPAEPDEGQRRVTRKKRSGKKKKSSKKKSSPRKKSPARKKVSKKKSSKKGGKKKTSRKKK